MSKIIKEKEKIIKLLEKSGIAKYGWKIDQLTNENRGNYIHVVTKGKVYRHGMKTIFVYKKGEPQEIFGRTGRKFGFFTGKYIAGYDNRVNVIYFPEEKRWRVNSDWDEKRLKIPNIEDWKEMKVTNVHFKKNGLIKYYHNIENEQIGLYNVRDDNILSITNNVVYVEEPNGMQTGFSKLETAIVYMIMVMKRNTRKRKQKLKRKKITWKNLPLYLKKLNITVEIKQNQTYLPYIMNGETISSVFKHNGFAIRIYMINGIDTITKKKRKFFEILEEDKMGVTISGVKGKYITTFYNFLRVMIVTGRTLKSILNKK